jgi:hypothetical protein
MTARNIPGNILRFKIKWTFFSVHAVGQNIFLSTISTKTRTISFLTRAFVVRLRFALIANNKSIRDLGKMFQNNSREIITEDSVNKKSKQQQQHR